MPFFVVLIFWLVVIFASFSLFAEPGPVVIASILLFRALGVERTVLDRRPQPSLSGPMQISTIICTWCCRRSSRARRQPSRPSVGHYPLRQEQIGEPERLDA